MGDRRLAAGDRGQCAQPHLYAFTCVRNPYTRILSSFFDKICGIQRNGKRYRGNLVPLLIQKYGIEVGGDDGKQEFDQIASFRRFLLFARDTIRWRRPMDPDIHWSAMSGHVSTFIVNGGRYDNIFWTERFNEGMQSVLDNIETAHAVDLAKVPRFNESEGHGPKRLHPVEAYFDDLSMHLVYEMYKRDFQLFKYDFENPGQQDAGGRDRPRRGPCQAGRLTPCCPARRCVLGRAGRQENHMKARVKWAEGRTFIGESGTGHKFVFGTKDEDGSTPGPSPMELVLIGTGGCSAYDVVSILEKGREPVEDVVVALDADRAEDTPAVFTRIHMQFTVTGRGVNPAKVDARDPAVGRKILLRLGHDGQDGRDHPRFRDRGQPRLTGRPIAAPPRRGRR